MIEKTLITNGPVISQFGAFGLSLILFLILDLRTQPMPGWAKFMLNVAMVYAVLVGIAFATNAYLDWRLYTFDLNGDGMFTEDEATADQVWFMAEWMSDAGRNLAPFFAALSAPVIVLFAYVLMIVRRVATKAFQAVTLRRRSR